MESNLLLCLVGLDWEPKQPEGVCLNLLSAARVNNFVTCRRCIFGGQAAYITPNTVQVHLA